MLSKVLVFVAFLVTQKALGETRYGEYSTAVVLGTIAGIGADLGLQVVFVREAARHRDQLGAQLATVLGAKLPLAAISALVLFGAFVLIAPGLIGLFVPAVVLLVLSSLATQLRSTFFATGELVLEVVCIVLETIVLTGVTVAAAATHQGVAAYLWAYAAAYGTTCVLAAVFIHRRYTPLRVRWDRAALARLLASGLPFALAFALSTIYFKVDVVILHLLRGDTQVGVYTAGYKFLEGLSFLPQALMNAIFPVLAVTYLRGREPMRDAYTRAFRLLAVLGMPLAVGISVLAPEIVRVTGVFGNTAPSLRILGVALLLLFVNNSFIFALGAMDRQLTFALLVGISVAVNVGINLVMIPLFAYADGYLAASWATLLTEVFLFAAGYVALSRQLGRLPWLRPALPIALSGAACLAVTILLRHTPLLLVVPAAAAVYVAALALTRGITGAEWRILVRALRMRSPAA